MPSKRALEPTEIFEPTELDEPTELHGTPAREQSSGVFAKGRHADASSVEVVLRSADEARRRGDPFRRWRRLGAPPEWQALSIAQRRAVEVLIWGIRVDVDDTW